MNASQTHFYEGSEWEDFPRKLYLCFLSWRLIIRDSVDHPALSELQEDWVGRRRELQMGFFIFHDPLLARQASVRLKLHLTVITVKKFILPQNIFCRQELLLFELAQFPGAIFWVRYLMLIFIQNILKVTSISKLGPVFCREVDEPGLYLRTMMYWAGLLSSLEPLVCL